jgi:rhamnose transport system substrate-binding protein
MRKEKPKMKKIIAILLVAMMALSMVACGGPADGEVTYAIVCKDASNPYMLRMISGFEAACEAIGVKSVTKSPESATVDGQISIVNELIAQGVKGIAIAANDAAALEATIKAATDAGIAVVTLDSDTKGSQMFVNQAGVEQVAQVLVDSCYDMAGGEGQFAVLSASSTATNQNAWIAAMKVIIEGNPEKYGKLEWVETVYGDDEAQKSTDEMQNLMTKYPDLKVVCCPTTVGILAAAKVVANDSSCTIKVAGLGLPSEMKDYVGEGKPCPYMYLWNPIDVGNCAAYMIKALLDGKVGDVGSKFTADNGSEYEIMAGDPAAKQIIVGPPFEFNGENIAEWAGVY